MIAPCWRSGSRPYKRGFAMQGPGAIVGFLLGAGAFYLTQDWRWLAGAVVLLANWPYTLIFIKPTNDRLMATPIDGAGAGTTKLIRSWGSLHAVRTLLGATATAIFVWALS